MRRPPCRNPNRATLPTISLSASRLTPPRFVKCTMCPIHLLLSTPDPLRASHRRQIRLCSSERRRRPRWACIMINGVEKASVTTGPGVGHNRLKMKRKRSRPVSLESVPSVVPSGQSAFRKTPAYGTTKPMLGNASPLVSQITTTISLSFCLSYHQCISHK